MKKILAILFIGTLLSCTDNFQDLNTDKKSLASVPGESLFNSAMERFYHALNNGSQNTNVFRMYAQYWSQTTYPEATQYQITTMPQNWFDRLYRDALKDMDEAKKIISLQETNVETAPIQKNKLAIISVNEVHMWMTLVDFFGNVPYSQALDFENPNPVYDDAKTIYYSLIDKLDKAISEIDASKASFASNEDLVNQGNTEMWLKAANSLKLRLAMRIADTDAAKAKTMAESALAKGVLSSLDEELSMEYVSAAPYTYPAYEDLVLSGRADYVASNTVVDILNGLNDPRRSAYFDSNLPGGYKGGVYGSANSFPNNTHIGAFWYTATSPGVTISCSEVEFLKAEGAARGFNMGGTAEQLYNKAVTTSILEWGGTEADAAAYLAQADVKYDAANWKKSIGIQKWISLFSNGPEGWATWRLFDYPILNVPEGLTYADIPRRLPYPINEATLNGANVKAAGAAIGGDDVKTRIFWDVK